MTMTQLLYILHIPCEYYRCIYLGFPGGSVIKNPPANAGGMGLIPGLGRFPWWRKWQPTLVFLPGKSHGERSLVGCSPWGCKTGRRELASKQQLHYTYLCYIVCTFLVLPSIIISSPYSIYSFSFLFSSCILTMFRGVDTPFQFFFLIGG